MAVITTLILYCMARCVCGTVVCVRSYQWQLLQHLYYTVWQGVCVWYCSVCMIISMAVITTLILYCMARCVCGTVVYV